MSLSGFVRRADPDRYLCALFAPAARREVLFTLYAFNHELARACEVTREPGLSLIRLQWWRDVVEGAAMAHEVATPLRQAVAAGDLDAPTLLDVIAARERAVEGGFDGVEEWRGWLLLGAGSVMVAAARALGAPGPAMARLREMGAGYGAAGQLRNAVAGAAQGGRLMPDDDAAIQCGRHLLGARLRCGRSWVAAALPAALARRDLGRPPVQARGTGDQMAVVAAWMTGWA